MVPTFYGSQRVLSENRPWAVALVLYIFTIAFGYLGRWIFEGHAYNVAFSSKYGDVALIGCVFIASRILHRYVVLPDWATSLRLHAYCAASGVGVGIIVGSYAIFKTTWAKSQVVDLCHNFLVVPFYVYVLATSYPVIQRQGTKTEKALTVLFVLIWVSLVWYDIHTGRENQWEWIMSHRADL